MGKRVQILYRPRVTLWVSKKKKNSQAQKQQAFCLSSTFDSLGGMTKSALDLRNLTSVILQIDLSNQVSTVPSMLRVGFVEPRAWQWPDSICALDSVSRDESVSQTPTTTWQRCVNLLCMRLGSIRSLTSLRTLGCTS